MSAAKRTREDELKEAKLEIEIANLELEAKTKLIEHDQKRIYLTAMRREDADTKASFKEARVYNFVESVGPTSVRNCAMTLEQWARRSRKPITIVFNSPGGSVFDGLALVDAVEIIKEMGIHVTTVCRGMAASMGGILFQLGDERVIGKNSHILIHEVSTIQRGKTSELEEEFVLLKRLQKRLVNILAERSTMSASQIERKWKKTEWWLDSDEAVELGFADRVG